MKYINWGFWNALGAIMMQSLSVVRLKVKRDKRLWSCFVTLYFFSLYVFLVVPYSISCFLILLFLWFFKTMEHCDISVMLGQIEFSKAFCKILKALFLLTKKNHIINKMRPYRSSKIGPNRKTRLERTGKHWILNMIFSSETQN